MSSISENVGDRLSRLPEEILSHILSLMPTKFAVRTSILSKRWRYIWTFITNLDFDYTRYHRYHENIIIRFVDGNEEHFTKFVDRVLKFCKTSHVKLFRLHISNEMVRVSSVSDWIDNAVRLNVHELDVCVIQHELPLSMFTCKTLTQLRLQLKYCGIDGWEFPSSVYLPCLKILDLVGHVISFPDALNLIHGCPMLESLSLEVSKCNNEEVCIFNIPTLKQLKLIYSLYSANKVNKIVLRVPKLEYLFVDGILCSRFVMKDVSSLAGASIACSRSTLNDLLADLLNKISGVQNLSIKNFPFTSLLPMFPNMKQLELNGIWQYGQITQFLESCPKLKVLCIDSIIWRDFKPEEESKLIPACMLTNLTTIKISKCWGYGFHIKFLEYMLENAQEFKYADSDEELAI